MNKNACDAYFKQNNGVKATALQQFGLRRSYMHSGQNVSDSVRFKPNDETKN